VNSTAPRSLKGWLERNLAMYIGLIAFSGGIALITSWKAGVAVFLIIWGVIAFFGAIATESKRQEKED